MPKISIIVPVYKVEQYLDRCVESVLAQTFKDFELILVDDGSPDNCPQMCDQWAKKDTRIVVIHQQNGGLSAARNTGIDWAFENSNSEWLTFIDSDDWVHPEYLERLYNAAVDNSVEISVCSFERVGDTPNRYNDNNFFVQIYTPEWLYTKDRVVATVAWGKLYKKVYFSNIRYPFGKIHEDEFVTYRILFQAKSIAFIENKMYYYYQNADGIMNSVWTLNRLVILDALYEQLDYYRKKGFLKAESVTCGIYSLYFYKLIRTLISSEIEEKNKKKHIRLYSKQLRRFLKKHKTTYRLRDNIWYYEFAYPIRMKLYWYYKACLRKISFRRDNNA